MMSRENLSKLPENLKTPGERIRFLRGKMSRRVFGAILEFSQGYIRDIEIGRAQPSRNFLNAIRDNLGTSINWILYNEQTKIDYNYDEAIKFLQEKNLFHNPILDKEKKWISVLYKVAKEKQTELTKNDILYYYYHYFPFNSSSENEKNLNTKALRIINIIRNSPSISEENLDLILFYIIMTLTEEYK